MLNEDERLFLDAVRGLHDNNSSGSSDNDMSGSTSNPFHTSSLLGDISPFSALRRSHSGELSSSTLRRSNSGELSSTTLRRSHSSDLSTSTAVTNLSRSQSTESMNTAAAALSLGISTRSALNASNDRNFEFSSIDRNITRNNFHSLNEVSSDDESHDRECGFIQNKTPFTASLFNGTV